MRKNILQFFYAVDGSKSNQASALGIKPGSPPTLTTPDLLTPPRSEAVGTQVTCRRCAILTTL
jgi:hypothetical protein